MATNTPLQEYFNSIDTQDTLQTNTSTVVDYLSTPQITPQSSAPTALTQYQSSSLEEVQQNIKKFQKKFFLHSQEPQRRLHTYLLRCHNLTFSF